MLDSALAYAGRGWPVIPLHTPVRFGPKKDGEGDRATCSCDRAACDSQGKHPRTSRGLRDASTDPGAVAAWWKRWPDANVGIVTGVGFDVLDLDGDEALDALDALAPEADPLIGPMVVTGRGIHIYMACSGAGNRTKVGGHAGIDWRGRSGYVVAPPSLHHLHGDRYEWSSEFGPDTPLLAAPGWLDALVHRRGTRRQFPAPRTVGRRGRPSGQRLLEQEIGRLALTREGGRNDALNRGAFTLGGAVVRRELDAHEVATALLVIAIRIGLSETEALASIESGMAAGMSQAQAARAA